MKTGHFYYITDQYFIDFPDTKLMQNKERINGINHDRPCFYAIKSSHYDIYWMIPFSSQVTKYRSIYDKKIQKYKHCDTIVFGEVLGYEKAFLIQNICPVTTKYIKNEYIASNGNVSVKVNGVLEKELQRKAAKVLALHRKGIKLILPDVISIEQKLLKDK